jgi:hypothetical protein
MSLSVLICVHSQNNFYDDLLIRSLKSLEDQTYTEFKTFLVLDECWEPTKKIVEDKINLEINYCTLFVVLPNSVLTVFLLQFH